MDGGKGLRHRNAECAARCRMRPSFALFAAATCTWSGWTRCRRSWLRGKGRPVRTCPPGKPSKTQGTRRARPGRCAARRCEANAFGSNSSSVPPGHPGRRLPWGRRSSAPVAARSPRSRSQTRGRLSRLAPPGSAFPRGWIAAKRGNHSSRSCLLFSAPTSLLPWTRTWGRSVQNFAPHSPHLPALCLGYIVNPSP